MKKIAPLSQARQAGVARQNVPLDTWVLVPSMLLLAFGMVMVASASISIAEGQDLSSYHYLLRHVIFVVMGLILAYSFRVIPIEFLERISRPLMLMSVFCLLMVFIPGVGYTVNGSTRWIRLGVVNFQVVEAVKLMAIIYVAGYLARKAGLVRTRFLETFKPLIFAGMLSLIL